ncbi:NUDIX hydrolase [Sunxiuqinia indica]|uniref:NUDIX hydrolase n=1 Tax=Sunxiuqinia indica TaxID=2692584 RepID=UPI00135ACDA1|nr:NUDIX domain-containing protein [Sunxiuqinia indica]
MYKVFLNEHQLFWDDEIDCSSNGDVINVVEIEDVVDVFKLFSKLESSKCVVKLIIISKNGQNLMQLLKNNITQIPAAGGLVINNKQKLLMIKRMGKWDLPKGKIEKNELPEDAAVREVEEECGIGKLKITHQLPSTFHLYRSPYIKKKNNWVLKETHWYEMTYSEQEKLVPQVEEQIEEARWVSCDDLQKFYQNTYGNLQDLLKPYLP